MVDRFAGPGFSYLSHREQDALVESIRRDDEAFPEPSIAGELYGEVCAFLDNHEADPIAGNPAFVERSWNRAFGLLATIRGYLRMLSILKETDSLAFCNQLSEDCAVADATMDPVFGDIDRGVADFGQVATLLFNGGVELPFELRPRRFAVVFGGLPLFSKQPSVEGGEYQNDLPRDLAVAVNRTQLAELAQHLIVGGRLNPEVFGEQNVLHEPDADVIGTIERACWAWQALNPGVVEPRFHLIISDIEMWGDYHGFFPNENPAARIGRNSVHWCPEIADSFDGTAKISFLVAEPREGHTAFDVTRFTDVNGGLHHTPTLGVRPTGDGRFDIGLDLRLRIDVREPNWILAVVVR